MESTGVGMTSSNKSRLMGSFSMYFAHGLLIIMDRDSEETHDQWDPSTTNMSIARDSIYLSVLPAVEGIVQVQVFEGGVSLPGMTLIYAGEVDFPSGKAMMYDPNGTISATFPAGQGWNNVSIEVNDADFPSMVIIRFSPSVY